MYKPLALILVCAYEADHHPAVPGFNIYNYSLSFTRHLTSHKKGLNTYVASNVYIIIVIIIKLSIGA